jgi:hypothetical protein
MAEQVPSVGRVVHYVLEDGPNTGQHRAAIIVRVWGDHPDAPVNLHVFLDGSNDVKPHNDGPTALWRTSVQRDDTGQKLRTWHWPEFVPPKA